MKKIFYFSLMILVVLTSCNNGVGGNTANNNIQLVRYQAQSCDETYNAEYMTGCIKRKEISNDTLFLSITCPLDGMVEVSPKVAFKSDTLFVDFPGGLPSCGHKQCCSLDLVITGVGYTKFAVKIWDQVIDEDSLVYDVYPIQFEVLNGDTVNKINEYGVKEGLWLTYDAPTGKLMKKEFYSGRIPVHGEVVSFKGESYLQNGKREISWNGDTLCEYWESGKIHKRRISDNQKINIEEEYYENGKLKDRCESMMKEDANGATLFYDTCVSFNKSGMVIKPYKK